MTRNMKVKSLRDMSDLMAEALSHFMESIMIISRDYIIPAAFNIVTILTS